MLLDLSYFGHTSLSSGVAKVVENRHVIILLRWSRHLRRVDYLRHAELINRITLNLPLLNLVSVDLPH